MAFNFPNGVPKFPAGVKTEVKSLKPASGQLGADSQADFGGWNSPGDSHPLGMLRREDQDLITQLVLHSGSLKDLASTYEVSYPTIRNRLDRVIERLRVIVAGRKPDGVAELLSQMIERGEIAPAAARQIEEAVRKRVESSAAVATQ